MPEPPELTVTREIAPGAKVSPRATIGPFTVIGPEVRIGPGTVVGRRVTILGRTTIGRDNRIDDGCVLGAVPQDLKYAGQPTYLIIGDRNRLDVNVTVHAGTELGGYLTRIGNDNVLAAAVHVAHDCYLDDRTYLGPCVCLAGHVRVETGAVVGEYTGAHHFTTIGRFSHVASRTPVRRDVPPFTVFGSLGCYTAPPAVRGVNEAGLAAAGLAEADRRALRDCIRHLLQDEQALAVKVRQHLQRPDLPEPVRVLCEFCRRSLEGKFGRRREAYRGQMPPEAREYLPPEALAAIEGMGRT